MVAPERTFSIEIKASALKALSKIPAKHRKHIQDVIDALAANPRPPGSKKLKGERNSASRVFGGLSRHL